MEVYPREHWWGSEKIRQERKRPIRLCDQASYLCGQLELSSAKERLERVVLPASYNKGYFQVAASLVLAVCIYTDKPVTISFAEGISVLLVNLQK